MQGFTQRYPGMAVITGASSGIGEQFAHILAAAGMDLVLVARREPELIALQQSLINNHGIKVMIQVCDLANSDAVASLLSQLQTLDIGVFISNAGFGVEKGAFLEADLMSLQDMWQVNSLAPAMMAHTIGQWFTLRKSSTAMIFTGSIEGEAAFPYSSAYAASKAFLHSLAYGLANELKEHKVDVLLLAPGATDTQAPISQGISRDQLVGLMSATDVANQALTYLGKGPRLIPGLHNRTFISILRLLPIKWASALSGWGMLQAIRKSQ